MIEDQRQNDHPGVTLHEPQITVNMPPLSELRFEDCVIKNDNSRVFKLGGISVTLTDQRSGMLRITGDMEEVLNKLATAQGITPSEALRKALATELYLYEHKQGGSTVLLMTADKEVREVLFR